MSQDESGGARHYAGTMIVYQRPVRQQLAIEQPNIAVSITQAQVCMLMYLHMIFVSMHSL